MNNLKSITLIALMSATGAPVIAGGTTEPVKMPQQYEQPQRPNIAWGGFYIGGKVGFHRGGKITGEPPSGNSTPQYPLPAPTMLILEGSGKSTPSNTTGGIFLGYNWERDGYVYGVDATLRSAGKHVNIDDDYQFKRGTQAALRLRAGKAVNNTLFYITGGIASERVKIASAGNSESKTMTGWTIGVGVDHAFTQNWIGRFELSHADYGKKTFATLGDARVDLKETTASFGIAYKF